MIRSFVIEGSKRIIGCPYWFINRLIDININFKYYTLLFKDNLNFILFFLIFTEIVAKYPENQTDFLLPIIKEQGNERRQYDNALHLVNYRLKELSTMLKLQRPLTMYVARHSWASAAKAKNVPLSVISEGMGHDSEATTQIYLASLETSVVDKANKMILGLL